MKTLSKRIRPPYMHAFMIECTCSRCLKQPIEEMATVLGENQTSVGAMFCMQDLSIRAELPNLDWTERFCKRVSHSEVTVLNNS